MATRTLALMALLLSIAVAAAAAERVLDDSFPAAGVDGVSITNGVGDVVVTAAEVAEITVDVTLIPRRGGLFSSYRNSEQEVASARLEARVDGGQLRFSLESSSDDPRFEAQWVVVVPTRVSIELTAGVGDVTVHGAASGLKVELGVGDAVIGVIDGPAAAEVGVGKGTVRGPASRYADVTASCGVGEADVLVGGERVTGGGIVGNEASWRGEGPHSIELEVGVGEARVVLE